MSSPSPSFRYRTLLELALIASAIYIFLLGAPGLNNILGSSTGGKTAIPTPKVKQPLTKPDSLVFPDPDLQCPEHSYNVHVYSTKPLVIYIDNFISAGEADELVELSSTSWQPSTIHHAGAETHDPSIRNSSKALLPRTTLTQCLESRALAFQGWPRNTFIERLWAQRYNASGHYARHYDWSGGGRAGRRESTFMVYLAGGGGEGFAGGGTEFPMLPKRAEGGWCRFVECEGEDGAREGTVFKVRKGAAVFWRNFDEEGRGFRETVHAALPVREGVKVGLNIWSWWQRGLEVGDLVGGGEEGGEKGEL